MKEKTSISQKLQKFGSVLAGMVIPNIGAFIGFGLITAFFLETGWTPNAKLAKLISPILNYLLPILIGHTGGKMFGGDRGGVIGALVTMGAIVAVDGTPMFLAAMILGPVAGVCIKKFDQAVDGKIPSGFELLTWYYWCYPLLFRNVSIRTSYGNCNYCINKWCKLDRST